MAALPEPVAEALGRERLAVLRHQEREITAGTGFDDTGEIVGHRQHYGVHLLLAGLHRNEAHTAAAHMLPAEPSSN